MKNLVALVVLVLAACGGATGKAEICDNGVDDDGNGSFDCNDGACAADALCKGKVDAGFYGSCAKCGQSCVVQSDCLAQSYGFDAPLASCLQGKCTALNQEVQVGLEVSTVQNWSGFSNQIGSISTRLVRRTALDGGSVTCANLKAAATGYMEKDSAQIENSNQFNLLGFDVAKLQGTGGQVFFQPFMRVGTGKDFLLWTELWAGQPATSTKLPTGNRYGYGCFDMGPEVDELKLEQDCRNKDAGAADAGTCRVLRVVMPPPGQ